MGTARFLPLCVALIGSASARPASVLPEMARHLAFADRCLKARDIDGVLASTDLILLPRVRIFVDGRASTESATTGLNEALDLWGQATEGGVAFVRVSSPSEADVIVRFQSHLGTAACDFGGFTTWRRSVIREGHRAAWRLHADMELRTVQPNGVPMTMPQVRHAALHELGHVLGLADSKRVGDAMGPLDLSRPVARPDQSEVDELRCLRREALQIRGAALMELLLWP